VADFVRDKWLWPVNRLGTSCLPEETVMVQIDALEGGSHQMPTKTVPLPNLVLTASQARELAQMLLETADQTERLHRNQIQ
jgi:hypothetical protein